MTTGATRTTLSLPANLLADVDRAGHAGQATSRNAFVVDAIRRAVAGAEAAVIDAAFAEMATDPVYQTESDALADEFAVADWEAFRLTEPAPPR